MPAPSSGVGHPAFHDQSGQQLAFKSIKVYGGFQKGLPLANRRRPACSCKATSATFGNWQGTDMSLDLIISPGVPPAADATAVPPKNLSLNWKKGQNASEAISRR